ncbi:hypothetical protein N802_05910 [Knoellia sinensis KCTC 19936]|uniref:Transcriptional regulator WhiB n=1 Tax=Knoellia sinensis KCTC 19936 TaxID=1385520 RepID=A0A0A0J208_9MICO|nr:WhiB family transcriptional regulator [Knoellia sinensis]KGN30739.1 hypothetical protein N802_05910 [Knoellia sinensis KCTC 19936]
MQLPCQAHPEDLWFAEEPDDIERAQALCHSCPLRRECLTDALDRREPVGVWGGEILHKGAIVPRKPRAGRPRKHPAAA